MRHKNAKAKPAAGDMNATLNDEENGDKITEQSGVDVSSAPLTPPPFEADSNQNSNTKMLQIQINQDINNSLLVTLITPPEKESTHSEHSDEQNEHSLDNLDRRRNSLRAKSAVNYSETMNRKRRNPEEIALEKAEKKRKLELKNAFVEAKIRAASELRKRAKRSPWLPVGPGILEKVGSSVAGPSEHVCFHSFRNEEWGEEDLKEGEAVCIKDQEGESYGKIIKLFVAKKGPMCTLFWYYTYDQAEERELRDFRRESERELFASDHIDGVSLNCIQRRISVICCAQFKKHKSAVKRVTELSPLQAISGRTSDASTSTTTSELRKKAVGDLKFSAEIDEDLFFCRHAMVLKKRREDNNEQESGEGGQQKRMLLKKSKQKLTYWGIPDVIACHLKEGHCLVDKGCCR